MAKLYLPLGDRIELAKAAMEFADKYGFKPVQLYDAMVAAVTEETEDGGRRTEDLRPGAGQS